MKHNNLLPNQHFRKDWQLHVKTWFNQPGKKVSRRSARKEKAAKVAPRPINLLRPIVRCPTLKYNTKLRCGRGFTLEELKTANINRKEALTIGIPVDHRRRNKSQESLDANVARLLEYKTKLIVFPKHSSKNSSNEDEVMADEDSVRKIDNSITKNAIVDEQREIVGDAINQYAILRKARSDKKLKGIREARAKAKAEEEAAKKK